MKRGGCDITGKRCPEHLYAHGEEAEQLRAGIEKIVEQEEDLAHEVRRELRRLLEQVDARDSLAWLEAKQKLPRKLAATRRPR